MSKTLVTVAVVSVLMFTAHFASADDVSTPGPKSRNTAIALSVGGTAVSAILVGAGARTSDATLAGVGLLSSLVTPSAGEIYGGTPITLGMGIRAASAVSVYVGAREALECLFPSDTCSADRALGGILISVGAIGYAAGIVYDIATAGTVVDEYNKSSAST